MKALAIIIISLIVYYVGLVISTYQRMKRHTKTSVRLSINIVNFILKTSWCHPYDGHKFMTVFQTIMLMPIFVSRFIAIYISFEVDAELFFERTNIIPTDDILAKTKERYINQLKTLYDIAGVFTKGKK